MSDTKFTSGPWQWWTSCSWRRLKNTDGADVLTPFVNRADGHPDCAVSDADAALIAAAPELYAALEALFACDMEHVLMFDGKDDQIAAIQQARAALKKARGEA